MAAGSSDHPPMLTTGRYAQWKSRLIRYIDTRPNGKALKKCILQGPYNLSHIIILGQPATNKSLEFLKLIAVEIFMNISPENKDYYDVEKEAIHLLLTGIGDEIYSTVDACKTAHDMWITIERMVKICDYCQVNVDLNNKSYHKLFDILKQYQKEVNEIHVEKITKNTYPLALVAVAQQYPDLYYQAYKSPKSYAPPLKQLSSTRSHASTRYKGKKIAKPITPPSESASKEDNTTLRYVNENQTGQFRNQRIVTAAGARETVGSQVVQQTRIHCFSCKEFGHFAKECKKPKRVKDYTYHKEKMLLYKQDENGVSPQAEQEVLPVESRSDAELLEKVQYDAKYNVFANERQHSEQPNSSNMYDNDNQADQNAKEYDDERVVLSNLKLDIDENKKIQKQLKRANTSLSYELEECKSVLDECKSSLEKSNRTRDRYLGALSNG
uniref:CCHC-type domain-containing protein n=1 Tax=Tanacetum cinerariifolium TaxID=118510 RepID=A0A699GQD1_TANCI|nr:hypothetical protein [Tanacetum cinerariifolium]